MGRSALRAPVRPMTATDPATRPSPSSPRSPGGRSEVDAERFERRHLRERFHQVRQATEAIASPLADEDQVVQSMPDVSPTKWHRAHTTWFFETFVLPHHGSYRTPDP